MNWTQQMKKITDAMNIFTSLRTISTNASRKFFCNRSNPTQVIFNITNHQQKTLNEPEIINFIKENTEISRKHLTPEIQLHLITPNCPLWYGKEDDCPVRDPFWAFFWPGGQALTRYILVNKQIVRNKTVLDVGSGCGASSIAASMCGARRVVANDICNVAATAIKMNASLNKTDIEVSTHNFIGTTLSSEWDIILLGDMFYDEEFTDIIAKWVKQLRAEEKSVFIGDPGRIALMNNHPFRENLEMVAEYELTPQAKEENSGLTKGYVWKCK